MRQHPFLFARKWRYFFNAHLFEGLVWAYGSRGVHLFVLAGAALAIVGGFRSAHACSGAQARVSPEFDRRSGANQA